MLQNAAKYQGYSFYCFWVIKAKPTGAKNCPPLPHPPPFTQITIKVIYHFLDTQKWRSYEFMPVHLSILLLSILQGLFPHHFLGKNWLPPILVVPLESRKFIQFFWWFSSLIQNDPLVAPLTATLLVTPKSITTTK